MFQEKIVTYIRLIKWNKSWTANGCVWHLDIAYYWRSKWGVSHCLCINVYTLYMHMWMFLCAWLHKHICVYVWILHIHTYIHMFLECCLSPFEKSSLCVITHMHTYIHIYIHTWRGIYTHINVHTYTHVHNIYVHIYLSIYICMYTYTYTNAYIYIHIHTHIYIDTPYF